MTEQQMDPRYVSSDVEWMKGIVILCILVQNIQPNEGLFVRSLTLLLRVLSRGQSVGATAASRDSHMTAVGVTRTASLCITVLRRDVVGNSFGARSVTYMGKVAG